MSSAAKITLCVPTIGRMEYLPQTRASIEAQTMKDGVDIVILCNGSSEEARAYVDAWAASSRNIRLVRSNPRVPMFDNFNLGIQTANTKYVTFFHDDDRYAPNYLERTVAFLEHHPSAVLVGSNYDFIDESGSITENRRWIAADAVLSRREYLTQLISRARNIIPMPGLVFRRSLLGAGFDTKLPIYWGDFVLLAQYAEQGDIGVIAEPIVQIRRHGAQASNAVPMSRAIPMRTKILMEYLAEYNSRFHEDAELVRQLCRRVERHHRVHLLWGWANAPSREESEACLDAMGKGPLERLSARVLRTAGELGLRPYRATAKGLSTARIIADRLHL